MLASLHSEVDMSVLKVPVQFKFINKPNDVHYCKPWLVVEPSHGLIEIS